MFAGSEWLILMALVAFVALVVWLVIRAARGGGATPISQARVRGSAEDVLRDLQLATAGISGTVTRRETPDSLTVEWTSIPGWAVVIAVLAFPLGLIALVARTSTVGTVVVGQESEQVARLQIAGVYKKATASAINAVIESRS